MKTALILIDIQNIYFTKGPYLLHEPQEASHKAKTLLDFFRARDMTVIHVKHAFRTDAYAEKSDFLNDIFAEVAPLDGEKIVHKTQPSSFYRTDLLQFLKENGIEHLVVAGMMSHMCIDTTVRACKDYGFTVTVIEDACTTKNLSFNGIDIPAQTVHQAFMAGLSGMFATVTDTENFLDSFPNS